MSCFINICPLYGVCIIKHFLVQKIYIQHKKNYVCTQKADLTICQKKELSFVQLIIQTS